MKNLTFFHPTDEFIDTLIKLIGDRFVIEIGCGNGEVLEKLIERKIPCIGIDPYIDIDSISFDLHTKILPFETKEGINFVSKLIKEGNRKVVLLVIRPCHSTFVQEYLSSLGEKTEMIYVGFLHNLELDFERELSYITLQEFPEHPDYNCVAVLKDIYFDPDYKRLNSWEKVDEKLKSLKNCDPNLKQWFLDLLPNNLKKYDIPNINIEKEVYGGNWEEYSDCKLLSRDYTKIREVELNILTYYVGGGHYSCYVKVKDEEFIREFEDGTYGKYSPWDKFEKRPKWVTYSDLVWFGVRDSKRTASLETGLVWLINTFEELNARYQKELGITLFPVIGSGLEDLIL